MAYFAVKHLIVAFFAAIMVGCVAGREVLPQLTGLPGWGIAALAGWGCGMVWQQAAFLAHDSLHNGVLERKQGRAVNWLGWFHGSVIFGISSEMWLEEHSVHHACTLRPTEDPQFNYLPIWLISEKELAVWTGNVVDRFLAPLLTPLQHWTFLPINFLVARYNLYVISWAYAIKHASLHDVLGMALYAAWYLGLMFSLPTGYESLVFHLASHWTVGIIHIQLMVSHLATETFTTEEELAEQFFTFQCKTTRNIDTEWWDSWFHGGLQYQIEHHLFPQLPRHNLKLVKPMVEAICAEHGVPYQTTSFTEAVNMVLSDFKRLSSALMSPEILMG